MAYDLPADFLAYLTQARDRKELILQHPASVRSPAECLNIYPDSDNGHGLKLRCPIGACLPTSLAEANADAPVRTLANAGLLPEHWLPYLAELDRLQQDHDSLLQNHAQGDSEVDDEGLAYFIDKVIDQRPDWVV